MNSLGIYKAVFILKNITTASVYLHIMRAILVFLCVVVITSANHLPNKWNSTHSPHPTHHSHLLHHSTPKPHPTSNPNPIKHYHLLLSHHNGNSSLNLCDFEPTKNHQLCDQFYPSSCFPPLCAVGPKGEHRWFKNKCYLQQYNGLCLSKFIRVDDNQCDARTKPPIDPNPCPISNDIEASVVGTIVHEVRKHCDCHL